MTPPTWLYDTQNVHRRNLNGQWSWFGLWAVCTVVGALILHQDKHLHGTHTQLGLPKCYSVVLWDRPCPGCGLTTSWTSILHGDWHTAFTANAFGPILYLMFTATALAGAYGSLKKWRLRSETAFANWTLIVTIVAFLVYGGIRFATTVYHDPAHAIWVGMQSPVNSR